MVSDATETERKRRDGLRHNAKRMRREQTPAESRFWHYAKNRGIGGMKFRRQVPVGPYIADFLCAEDRLIVEIDGGQHGEGRDAGRDARLRSMGYRTLRFWNSDVMADMVAVAETILAARRDLEAGLAEPPPHPALSPGGGEER